MNYGGKITLIQTSFWFPVFLLDGSIGCCTAPSTILSISLFDVCCTKRKGSYSKNFDCQLDIMVFHFFGRWRFTTFVWLFQVLNFFIIFSKNDADRFIILQPNIGFDVLFLVSFWISSKEEWISIFMLCDVYIFVCIINLKTTEPI